MKEDKSQLMSYAMYAGLYLGVFWVIKHFITTAMGHFSGLNVLASFLSVGTPLILYFFLTKYKTKITGNAMGFWHGVQFGIMLFFFASILEAMAVFIHVTWIDTAYIPDLYQNMLETAKTFNFNDSLLSALEDSPTPSVANYIFSNVIMADVFLGFILSLLIVPIVIRYTPVNNSNTQPNNNIE